MPHVLPFLQAVGAMSRGNDVLGRPTSVRGISPESLSLIPEKSRSLKRLHVHKDFNDEPCSQSSVLQLISTATYLNDRHYLQSCIEEVVQCELIQF
jgi:hypothetical protein